MRENNMSEDQIKLMPTEKLLKSNKMQSIHQMGAQCIVSMFKKIITTEKPRALYEPLSSHEGRHGTTWRIKKYTKAHCNLKQANGERNKTMEYVRR